MTVSRCQEVCHTLFRSPSWARPAAGVFFVPGVALTVLGGVLFGAAIGTLLVVVGATLGAVAAFAIARQLGRERVQRLAGGRLRRADEWIGRKGFGTILLLRLVPLVPFNALNDAAGLSGVSPRAYAAATAVGIVPGSFAYAALGGAMDQPWSPAFFAALALVLGVAVLGGRVHRRRHTSAACS